MAEHLHYMQQKIVRPLGLHVKKKGQYMYFFLQQDTLKIMVTDLKVYVNHYTTPLPLTLMVCLGGLNPKTSFVLA